MRWKGKLMKIRLFEKISGFLFLPLIFFQGGQLEAQAYEYGLPVLIISWESILLPGVLGLTENLQLAISGRFVVSSSGNSYHYGNEWVTFNRKTLNPDFSGLVLKTGSWRLAIGHSPPGRIQPS